MILLAGCSQQGTTLSSSSALSSSPSDAPLAQGKLWTQHGGQLFWDDQAVLTHVRNQISLLRHRKLLINHKTLRKQVRARTEAKANIVNPACAHSEPKAMGSLYRPLNKHTLAVFTFADDGSYHCGTGVAIGHDAIVTNCHVLHTVPNETLFAAMDSTGNVYPIKEILASNLKDDIVILRLDMGKKTLCPAPLAKTLPDPGTEVFQIGHTREEFFSATRGHIIRYYRADRENNGVSFRVGSFDISNKVSAGGSGSGLFNARGELVGIYTYRTWYYQDSESTIKVPKQPDGSTEYIDKISIYARHSCVPVTEIHALILSKPDKKK
ncbi:MAG: trypsin-like peptidase domain-containing protein [Phycisphaerales bacterium]|jgi:hypothetical protein|nr:trypsin-like peptidase domain-containing protein [Phycisphaerales bacterium]